MLIFVPKLELGNKWNGIYLLHNIVFIYYGIAAARACYGKAYGITSGCKILMARVLICACMAIAKIPRVSVRAISGNGVGEAAGELGAGVFVVRASFSSRFGANSGL